MSSINLGQNRTAERFLVRAEMRQVVDLYKIIYIKYSIKMSCSGCSGVFEGIGYKKPIF